MAALIAVQPAVAQQGGGLPLAVIAGVVVAVAASGLLATLIATAVAARLPLLESLKANRPSYPGATGGAIVIDRTFGTVARGARARSRPCRCRPSNGPDGAAAAAPAISTAPMPATLAAKAADVWAVPVGIGHASPLVDGQRVYVFARKGEQEVAQALDLATGKALWSAAYDQPYTMNSAATGHGKGPKSTPLLAGGRLYTLGITGVLERARRRDAARCSGGTPSTRSSARRRTSARRCRRSSTTACVIAHVGGIRGGALRAFDPATGATKWSWTGDGPGYASPVALVAGGVRQIVTETQTKVVGVDAGDRRAALVAAARRRRTSRTR